MSKQGLALAGVPPGPSTVIAPTGIAHGAVYRGTPWALLMAPPELAATKNR